MVRSPLFMRREIKPITKPLCCGIYCLGNFNTSASIVRAALTSLLSESPGPYVVPTYQLETIVVLTNRCRLRRRNRILPPNRKTPQVLIIYIAAATFLRIEDCFRAWLGLPRRQTAGL